MGRKRSSLYKGLSLDLYGNLDNIDVRRKIEYKKREASLGKLNRLGRFSS